MDAPPPPPDVPEAPRSPTAADGPPPIPKQGMVRNIAWLSGGSILVKPLWILFIVAACPRLLGVEAYGTMQSALALAAMILMVSDMGTSNLTLREVAAQPGEAVRYLSNILVLRGVLAAVCILGALLAAVLLDYDRLALLTVAAACAYLLAQYLIGFSRVFFRAAENLRYEAVSTVAERALVIAVGSAFLVTTRSPAWTLGGMALGAGVVGLTQIVWISRHLARFDAGSVSVAFIRQAAWLAVPLGIADLLLGLYYRADQVMVEAMAGDAAAGQYGQAYRILEALSLLPAIVVQGALFPRLTRLGAEGGLAEARRLAVRTGVFLTASGIGVSVLLWVAAPLLIRVLTGDAAFDPAASALRVLVWAFPLTCLKDLFFITSLSRQQYRTPVVIFGAAVALNVAMNLWAIPRYGIVGASVTTVISEALTVLLFLIPRRSPAP